MAEEVPLSHGERSPQEESLSHGERSLQEESLSHGDSCSPQEDLPCNDFVAESLQRPSSLSNLVTNGDTHRVAASKCTCTPVLACKEFMVDYVSALFKDGTPPDKKQFNALCELRCGRREFGRAVTQMRVNSKEVSEIVFLSLTANFATLLHFCNEEDDIEAAKVLMILTFTFQCDGKFLYQELLRHPIWHSLRFWNAAFLHAVHSERKLRSPTTNCFARQSEAQREECAEIHKNTFFGQLSSFITNMKAFGLSTRDIAEFRDKMFEISGLDEDQREMLCQLTKEEEEEEEEEGGFLQRLDSFMSFSKNVMDNFSRTLSFESFGVSNDDRSS